jgi:hypothetical protein
MIPDKSHFVAAAPTASAMLASKGRVFIAVTGIMILPKVALDPASRIPRRWLAILRGKGDLGATNFSQTAVVAENIIVPA